MSLPPLCSLLQHGVIVADEEEYFIEPLSPGANVSMGGEGRGSPHVVYKRSSLQYPHMDAACGVMGRCSHLLLLNPAPNRLGKSWQDKSALLQIYLLNCRFLSVCFYPFLPTWEASVLSSLQQGFSICTQSMEWKRKKNHFLFFFRRMLPDLANLQSVGKSQLTCAQHSLGFGLWSLQVVSTLG